MNKTWCLALSAVFFAAMAASSQTAQAAETDKKDARVFELRTYIAHPGRLDALNKRFRDHTCKLFEKHGMQIIGFWTPAEGPEAQTTLVYILAFPSREAQKKAWDAFRKDPDWIKAKDASEKDGPIVKEVKSQNLNPTDYSPAR